MLSHYAINFNQLSSKRFYVEFGCSTVVGGRRRENFSTMNSLVLPIIFLITIGFKANGEKGCFLKPVIGVNKPSTYCTCFALLRLTAYETCFLTKETSFSLHWKSGYTLKRSGIFQNQR